MAIDIHQLGMARARGRRVGLCWGQGRGGVHQGRAGRRVARCAETRLVSVTVAMLDRPSR